MKDSVARKNSIARKVTRRVSLLLLAASALLFIGSFHTVSFIIRKENRRYAMSVLGVYVDLLTDESYRDGTPVDTEHTENIIRYGEYLCDWYGIDYTFVYVPDTDAGTVTYVAACALDGLAERELEGNLVGCVEEKELTPEERAVWEERAYCAQYYKNDEYGREVSTVLLVEDAFGNRALARIDTGYLSLRNKIISSFVLLMLVIIVVIAGVYIAVYRIIQKRISRPAQLLSCRMQDYIADGRRSGERLTVEEDATEYSMIASAFNRMTDDIDRYVESIDSLTRDQERRQTELDIASRIQQGFLPPADFRSPHCAIHAVMTPARDVGGDLYDYVALDENRTLAVIADVSGKGVSAAMFMSVTLTLIRQFAKMGLAPDEILRRTNDTLSDNNAAMLFATAFVAIYDSSTGLLTYSNAGHNRPYVIGGRLRMLDGGAGVLLGLFPGERYTTETVPLDTGETLFLYTDGVSEAVNPERKLFGVERLEETLREFRRCHAENALDYVSKALSAFAGTAEPHDDVTMLTLTATQTLELSLAADVREQEKIKAAILSLRLPRSLQLKLCLSAEECFVNVCSYAFEGRDASQERVGVRISVSDRVRIRFEDGGVPYDPLQQVACPEDYDMQTQIGGLGKLISFTTADDVHYEHRDGKNVLTLIKYFEEDKQ